MRGSEGEPVLAEAAGRSEVDEVDRPPLPPRIQVGVGDLTDQPAEIVSTERVEQMHLPAPFVTAMRSVIAPGTTVPVTQASVGTGSTGMHATVLDAGDEVK